MKRMTETFDVYFLHREVLETHLATWVVAGFTAANTAVHKFILHYLEENNSYTVHFKYISNV